GNGLVITADNVTIDLNGFTLGGTGSGNVNGILVSGAHQNIVIHNGTVRFFGGTGIDAHSAEDCRFENLSVSNNKGVGVFAGAAATVTRCKFVSNGSYGLSGGAGCYISECTARLNKGAGIQVGGDGTITRS